MIRLAGFLIWVCLLWEAEEELLREQCDARNPR